MLAGRSTGQAGEIDLCDLDDGIGAAEDAQFAQDIRYMNLHRGLADLEFIGDLLVLQTLAQHIEHPQLLRREVMKALQQLVIVDPGLSRYRSVPVTPRKINR